MKTFILEEKISLENASKTHELDGRPYDESDDDSFSEWAYAFALSKFEIGQEITEEELMEALVNAKSQQILDNLEKMGLIETVWDNDGIGYRVK